jgi:hypothetical protein
VAADETDRSDDSQAEADLKQPDEAIKDLEPDEQEGEAVTGGAFDTYLEFKYQT